MNHFADKETQFHQNNVADFDEKPENVEKTKTLDLKSHILEYVSKDIPAQFNYLLKCAE